MPPTAKRKRKHRSHHGPRIGKAERDQRRAERQVATLDPTSTNAFEACCQRISTNQFSNQDLNDGERLCGSRPDMQTTFLHALVLASRATTFVHYLKRFLGFNADRLIPALRSLAHRLLHTPRYSDTVLLMHHVHIHVHGNSKNLFAVLGQVPTVLTSKNASDHLSLEATSFGQVDVLRVLAQILTRSHPENVKNVCKIDPGYGDLFVDLFLMNPFVYHVLVEHGHQGVDSGTYALNRRMETFMVKAAGARVRARVAGPSTGGQHDHTSSDPVTASIKALCQVACQMPMLLRIWTERVFVDQAKLLQRGRQVLQDLTATVSESPSLKSTIHDIRVFGSFAVDGLISKSSDLDLCVLSLQPLSNEQSTQVFETLVGTLRSRRDTFSRVEYIRKARVPVVKLQHRNRIKVDISVANHAALRNCALLRRCCATQPALVQLVQIAKYWARRRKIVDPRRGLNGHAWNVLCMFYLQARGLLPFMNPDDVVAHYSTTQHQFTDEPQHKSIGNSPHLAAGGEQGNAAHSNDTTEQPARTMVMLFDFCKFYATEFDFVKHQVSLYNAGWQSGEPLRELSRVGEPATNSNNGEQNVDVSPAATNPKFGLAIQDPTELTRDLARRLSPRESNHLKAEFLRAYRMMAYVLKIPRFGRGNTRQDAQQSLPSDVPEAVFVDHMVMEIFAASAAARHDGAKGRAE